LRTQKNDLLANDRFNAVGHVNAGLLLDVPPDLEKIDRCLGGENVATLHSGGVFQISQVCVQPVFRDSLAAVELLYAAPDFRIDGVPVLQEPAVLFFLGIEKPQQCLLCAGCAGGLYLFLHSGFEIRVSDFDLHAAPFAADLLSPVPLYAAQRTQNCFSPGR